MSKKELKPSHKPQHVSSHWDVIGLNQYMNPHPKQGPGSGIELQSWVTICPSENPDKYRKKIKIYNLYIIIML